MTVEQTPERLFELANIDLQNNRVDAALAHLHKILESHPRHPDTLVALVQVYERLSRTEEMVIYLEKLVEIHPQPLNPESYIYFSNYQRSRGSYKQAIWWCKEGLRANPQHIPLYETLAELNKEVGNFFEAIRCYKKILLIEPSLAEFSNDHHVHFSIPSNIERLEAQLSDLNSILESCPEILSLDESEATQLFFDASMYASVGRLDTAVSSYEEALQAAPNFAEAHYCLANVFFTLSKVNEALHHFHQTIQLKPSWAEAYYHVGRALAALCEAERPEQRELPLQYFLKAIELKPDFAEAYLECGNNFHYQAKERESFPYIHKYMELREKQIADHPLSQLNIRFMTDFAYAIGHLAESPDVLIKLQKLGWAPTRHLICLAPPSKVANPALLECWKKYLTVITDKKTIKALRPLEKILSYNSVYAKLPDERVVHVKVVKSALEKEWRKQQREPLIRLSDSEISRGRETLRSLGVPENAWFVAVHVREGGFKKEGDSLHNKYRNTDIDLYRKSFQSITDRGGWVIRMGEPSMKPLEPMPHVVDYAHSAAKSDWMDIFLCSQSRFFLGTTGGLIGVPSVFGIPVIATNYAPTPILYTEQDLTIPKLFWDTKKERLLSFREILSPPIIQNEVGSLFQEWGYELIDNKEDELDAIVQEMLDKLDGKVLYTSADEELQQKFKALFPADFGEISARIGRDFLRKYKELLE